MTDPTPETLLAEALAAIGDEFDVSTGDTFGSGPLSDAIAATAPGARLLAAARDGLALARLREAAGPTAPVRLHGEPARRPDSLWRADVWRDRQTMGEGPTIAAAADAARAALEAMPWSWSS
jgi:hypothetical protein